MAIAPRGKGLSFARLDHFVGGSNFMELEASGALALVRKNMFKMWESL